MTKRKLSVAASLAAVLAPSGAALALAGGPKIEYTARDQAAARSEVVHRADLQPPRDWRGYFQKPSKDELHPNVCSDFHPVVSDLVVTGAETSTWTSRSNQLSVVSSKAVVFRTAHMARLNWRRTMEPPEAAPCIASAMAQGLGATLVGKLTSFKSIAIPRIAPRTAAFRAVYELESKPTKIPLIFYTVYASRGRSQLWLAIDGVDGSVSLNSAVRLARTAVGRMRA